ncbi:MAG: hypothetical protein A3I05_09965 [Deltaproteobacteria bacterium RIFCSPLOWO2_02_FULL_44_10]|nr:MAG: hypothetical protein A3C46_09220 [Deltaproteobacteria bacterium RIFCSPHIGHO2_02_FULL_44_16]OGQ45016.1 MAG: hypothetical protein A3I05_09965 [Deltaproteobacteria bacterium RIFCSPLOWO2_02_FULL_44_10]
MARKEIEMLVEKWANDIGFRTKMRKNPIGTLQSTGVKLTAEETNAFRKIDWKLNDQQLTAKMNKGM